MLATAKMLYRSWDTRATLALALAILPSTSSGLHIPPNAVNGSLRSQYNYIVVGGGASGLVVANRLTEDPGGEYAFPSTPDSNLTDSHVQ